MALTLLIGGVRSGKSRLAADLVSRADAPVVVIATGEPRDDEMAARIERHRAERPGAWTTIEEPVDLERALGDVPSGSAVLLDCLTLWVSNLLEQEPADEQIEARAWSAAKAAAQRDGSVVAVTNEVGSGVIASTPIGRRYTDVLGRVNAIWAEAAQRTALVVAGKVLPLQGTGVLLDE